MPGSVEFNRETVRSEVAAEFERYETALRAHDLPALHGFFLASSDTVRFGVAEQQYGSEAIARWRAASQPVNPQRVLLKLVIVTYDDDCASVSAELADPGETATLRQSQVWVRTAQGWKIAAAHVSLNPGRDHPD